MASCPQAGSGLRAALAVPGAEGRDYRGVIAVLPRPDPGPLVPSCPDQPGPCGPQYSLPQLGALTAHILKTAVTSYRQLAETCFPSFGTALGLYPVLPAVIEGIVKTSETPDGEQVSPACSGRHPDRDPATTHRKCVWP